MPKPSEMLATRREEVLAIGRIFRAEEVRVFGSVVRGDDHPNSDLDLLVRFAPDATLLDQAGLQDRLHDLLGFEVDVVSEGDLVDGRHDQLRASARPL